MMPEESLEGLHPAFRLKVTYASLCDLVLAISRLFNQDHSKKRGPLRGLDNIGEMALKVKRPPFGGRLLICFLGAEGSSH